MSDDVGQHSVLFVCLGNICRSPLAEGVFRARLEARGLSARFHVDSCGTGAWHVGNGPDPRSVAVARDHGIDISGQRARQLSPADFRQFDWIVAMDTSNYRGCQSRAPGDFSGEIVTFMSFVSHAHGPDVPDPYYGGGDGFERVFRILDRGMEPLLDHILG